MGFVALNLNGARPCAAAGGRRVAFRGASAEQQSQNASLYEPLFLAIVLLKGRKKGFCDLLS